MKSDFSNAKVGDKVWGIRRGWGTINEIRIDGTFPLIVYFNTIKVPDTFTLDGKWDDTDTSPTLFWDEIKFEIPQHPKRMVDKEYIEDDYQEKIHQMAFSIPLIVSNGAVLLLQDGKTDKILAQMAIPPKYSQYITEFGIKILIPCEVE